MLPEIANRTPESPLIAVRRRGAFFQALAIALTFVTLQWHSAATKGMCQEPPLAAPSIATSETQTAATPGTDYSQFEASSLESECDQCIPAQRSRILLAPYWENGLHFISDDEQFNLHFGGTLHWDNVWLIGSDDVLAAPGSNATSTTDSGASLLRRARLLADGTIYDRYDFSVEFDLANAANENKGLQPPTEDNLIGSPIPRNVWLQMRDVPLFGHVRIGNQVKPIGMTRNTSHSFLPFLERADNMDGFYGPFDGGYQPGISAMSWTESKRIAWRYGLFRPLNDSNGIAFDAYAISGRITGLPIFEDDGSRLLHVGLSGSQGSLVDNEFRLRARPLLRNGPGYSIPVIADTGKLPGNSQFLVGPELAAVLDSWTFQAEWTGQFFTDAVAANGQSQGTVFFQGGYAQVLYFLTGEHQEYDHERGTFTRVVPRNIFKLGEGGLGAWQLGARFSYLNLNDKAIDGGQIMDMTVGLNWFLNPNMKIQGNYLLTHRDGQQGQGDGWFSGLGIRAACDF